MVAWHALFAQSNWSLKLIAYGYQFGFLMLTPLAPVFNWVRLDSRFVKGLWIETALAGKLEQFNKAS